MAGSGPAVGRREFIKLAGVGGVGLAVGCSLGPRIREPGDPDAGPWLWVKIGPPTEGEPTTVTVVIPRCEMGQGTTTGLAAIVAEELDVDWSQVRAEWAPPLPQYGRVKTVASDAVRTLWQPLRETGATARQLLVAAAAEQWDVDPRACRTAQGHVRHPDSGRSSSYAALADRAAALPLPERIELKRREDFSLIGRSLPRLDLGDAATGAARYGIDVELPGMLVATVVHCPAHGGRLGDWDPSAALAVPGVRDAFGIRDPLEHPGWTAVAVVADGYWSAHKGALALELAWDVGGRAGWNDARVREALREMAEQEEIRVVSEGDTAAVLGRASRTLTASYWAPHLAHATMEPMNCTAHVEAGRCQVWAPTQNPGAARRLAARASGMAEQDVIVHQTLLGGGFGRRLAQDYVVQAVQIARRARAPVKLIWSREEDTRNDWYRPASVHLLEASLDRRGLPIAWRHRIGGDGVPTLLTQGIDALPYAISNRRISATSKAGLAVRTGAWRSLARSQNCFVTECFLDEVAHAGGHDPLELRRQLLREAPRPRAVLELAARRSGWGRRRAPDRHLGIALVDLFGSVCAVVAEISLEPGGGFRVRRIVCAADCGQLVNPDLVQAQLEGGIVFGLSAALHGEITLREGRVQQSNFHDSPILRLSECPPIEVHHVASRAEPGSVGELSVPPVAPAVANALLAATGEPIRSLPIRSRAR